MTVVEAASQGAPSLVQGGGHVGATDLLSADGREVLCCDMDQPAAQVGGDAQCGAVAGLAAEGRHPAPEIPGTQPGTCMLCRVGALAARPVCAAHWYCLPVA